MFAFFVFNELKGFWGNKIGDVFFQNTCKKMGWDITNTSLVYFEGLTDQESLNCIATKSSIEIYNKQLVQVGTEEKDILDENGIVIGSEIVPVNEMQDVFVRSIPSQIFVLDGVFQAQC